ncbi:MAG: hypothetical protein HZA36_01795 [Parcubacteria group bacterium]|nr:hypothetical protein [Parcubacteria group bacterium]
MKFGFPFFAKQPEPPKRTPQEEGEAKRRREAEFKKEMGAALHQANLNVGDPARRAEARKEGEKESGEAPHTLFESLEPEEQKDVMRKAHEEEWDYLLEMYLTPEQHGEYEEGGLTLKQAKELVYQAREEGKRKPEFYDLYLSQDELREYRRASTSEERKTELYDVVIERRAAALAMEVKNTEDGADKTRRENALFDVLEERAFQAVALADEAKKVSAMKSILGGIGALRDEHAGDLLETLLHDNAFRVLITKDKDVFQKVAVVFERIPGEYATELLQTLADGEGIKDKDTRDALAALPLRFKEHIKELGEAEIARLQQEIERGVVNGAELRDIEYKAKRRAQLVDKFALTEKNRNASLKWEKFGDTFLGGMGKVGMRGLKALGWGVLGVGALAIIAVLGPIALALFAAKYIVEGGLKSAGKGKH